MLDPELDPDPEPLELPEELLELTPDELLEPARPDELPDDPLPDELPARPDELPELDVLPAPEEPLPLPDEVPELDELPEPLELALPPKLASAPPGEGPVAPASTSAERPPELDDDEPDGASNGVVVETPALHATEPSTIETAHART